ncbi:hypothetical protein LJR168_002709 [Pseudoxanthomonas sp. LjRoot168]|uniref:hypothetical protein n=1 Tax=unclassified Pseudoxanthomonas TaxID=2645906 RepID=UPI002624127E|nr:hypothetical protein [uncultured Pseudoxanthomonas sp.]
MPAIACPSCDHARILRAHLTADDVDAAIEGGLMAFQPCDCAGDAVTAVLQAQQRLRTAWAARARYRQRQARLACRAAEREARRLKVSDVASDIKVARPALPSGAAAILARAKAKAAERMKP